MTASVCLSSYATHSSLKFPSVFQKEVEEGLEVVWVFGGDPSFAVFHHPSHQAPDRPAFLTQHSAHFLELNKIQGHRSQA